MGKKTGTFTEGQLVYAKVKGYSPWPAKITKVISKSKYKVYFYGTREIGNCKSEDLNPYDEKNRAKFNTERQLKKSDYKEAVDQIELALQGNDPALELPVEDNGNDESLIKAEEPSQDASEIDPDESQLQIAEEAPKSTPIVTKKKAAVKKSLAQTLPPQQPVVQTLVESETKENDEKISRSGRKIKEKKMNNDEMDPDEALSPPRKRLKTEDTKQIKQAPQPLNDSSTINDFCLSKMHILQDPDRKQFLTTQFEMMKIVQEVKQHLGLEQADVDQSLELLKVFQQKVVPNITKLMLLKYPNIVITLKKLRNYIGNVTSWNLETEQLAEFQQKAKMIREVAEEICSSLKLHFNDIPENVSFWDFFSDEQKQFSERFNKLDVADLFEAFNEEELESFANRSTENDDAQVPQLPTEMEAVATEN